MKKMVVGLNIILLATFAIIPFVGFSDSSKNASYNDVPVIEITDAEMDRLRSMDIEIPISQVSMQKDPRTKELESRIHSVLKQTSLSSLLFGDPSPHNPEISATQYPLNDTNTTTGAQPASYTNPAAEPYDPTYGNNPDSTVIPIEGAAEPTKGIENVPNTFPQRDAETPHSTAYVPEPDSMGKSDAPSNLDAKLITKRSNHPFFKDQNKIVPEINPFVDSIIRYYQNQGRASLEKALSSFEIYYPLVKVFLMKNNLPLELSVLPIVLSGYNNNYRSSMDERGIWQMNPGIARAYGLTMSETIDERMDLELGNIAAVDYCARLFKRFGSWDLAVSAYRTSAEYVSEEVRKLKTHSFWELASNDEFQKQSKDVVPRFYAVLTILTDPERFGFEAVNYNGRYDFESINFPYPFTLDEISDATRVSTRILRELNPQLLASVIPDNAPNFKLKVPKGYASYFMNLVANQNKNLSKPNSESAPIEQLAFKDKNWTGDQNDPYSNDALASRFDRLDQETATKQDSRSKPFPNENDLFEDGRPGTTPTDGEEIYGKPYGPIKPASHSENVVEYYRVEKGDTMYSIAKKLNISRSELANFNHITDPNLIHIGDTIKIPGSKKTVQPNNASYEDSYKDIEKTYGIKTEEDDEAKSYESRPEKPARTKNGGYTVYEVQTGDSLIRIARKYGIALSDLYQNNPNLSDVIVIGQKIRIPIAQKNE